MIAESIMKLKVIDMSNGNTIGVITGILINGEFKEVVALEVGSGWLSHPNYIPFGSINAFENEVLMISSSEVLTGRGEYKSASLLSSLSGRKVYTEEGKNLGTVHDYDIDTQNGKINSITVALDTFVMGVFLRTEGKRFNIPRDIITAIGDCVVVDNSIAITEE